MSVSLPQLTAERQPMSRSIKPLFLLLQNPNLRMLDLIVFPEFPLESARRVQALGLENTYTLLPKSSITAPPGGHTVASEGT